jgi:D-aminopeptidase
MTAPASERRRRARELGVAPGTLAPGERNAITDVAGVRVGQRTLCEGDGIRTGVTVVLPHGGDPYDERVPAGLFVANGFGKLAGATQVQELGELETPIALTNTLSVPEAAAALIEWTLALPGHHDVRSVNPFVGETNDGVLNDIRARVLRPGHVLEALAAASEGTVDEGCVGGGTGTVALGFKAGIGTASRRAPTPWGEAIVGVLVQANFGGVLRCDGLRVGERLGRVAVRGRGEADGCDGSAMIVVATDAPLSDRNLRRLAVRAMAGMARTGAAFAHGSGDYALAFSTAPEVRRLERGRARERAAPWPNESLSALAPAAIEATEEAILNALCMAQTTRGHAGSVAPALPLGVVERLARAREAAERTD